MPHDEPLEPEVRDALRQQLIEHEGLRLRVYVCSGGKATIGVGRNLEDVGISREEALLLLDHDIDRVAAELDAALPWWRELDPVRRQVLANMAFNLGLATLQRFRRMLAALRDGDYARAADEMLDSLWARQVGRRAEELARMMRRGECA